MDSNFLLIAIDDETLRDTVAVELTKLTGLQSIKAVDGVQAYQKTRNQDFCAIVSGFNLKKLNGAQFLASARETKSNKKTPFIFYTKDIENAKTQTRGHKGVFFYQVPTELQVIANKIVEVIKKDISKKTFSLDVDFINPFIESSVKILADFCHIEQIESKNPYILNENNLDIDISGTLKISSPYFKGVIAISFNQQTYQTIIDKMLTDNKSDIKIEQDDGVKEMINIIFGQTKAILNNRGYSIERAVPNAIRGKNHQITDNKIPILVVPLQSNSGNFWIQICVKAI